MDTVLMNHASGHHNKAGIAILTSEKLYFKPKTVVRDEEEYCIIIKGSIQQALRVTNIYTSNLGAAKYINQLVTILKELIDNNMIVGGAFDTSLTPMDRSS